MSKRLHKEDCPAQLVVCWGVVKNSLLYRAVSIDAYVMPVFATNLLPESAIETPIGFPISSTEYPADELLILVDGD